jgi:hypothetical protein
LLRHTIDSAPVNWKHLPKLQRAMDDWYSLTKLPGIVPLMEFTTRLGGRGCVTSRQFLLVQQGLLVWNTPTTYVLDLSTLDVVSTPDHPLSKLTLLQNGKKVTGCNPIGMTRTDLERFVQRIQVLQSLQ